MFGAIANALAGVAAALLAKEVYEECVGHVGAMDVYTLGSATLLLCISIGIRFYHVPEGTTDPVPGSTGKPVLAVDLDECCCEYVPAFIKFMNARHGTKLVLEDFTSYMFWQVPKCKLQSREHAISRVYEFHASKYFDQIEPIRGAKIALDHLKASFELHVVTSRQADIEEQTRIFVRQHFPDTFAALHFGNHFGKTGAKVSKPDMCKKIGALALIDDSLDYAKQCAAAGLPVFLFGDYPWNETAEPLDQCITRVGTWRMVAQLVSPATVGVN